MIAVRRTISRSRYLSSVLAAFSLLCALPGFAAEAGPTLEVVGREEAGLPAAAEVLDFRHRPSAWRTAAGLPGDPHPCAVRSDGAIMFAERGGVWTFRPALRGVPGAESITQSVWSPRAPIVATTLTQGTATLLSSMFARAPEKRSVEDWGPRRADLWTLSRGGSGGRLAVEVWPPAPVRLDGTRTLLVRKDDPSRVVCMISPPVEMHEEPRGGGLVPTRPAAVVRGWAAPEGVVAPRFRNAMVGVGAEIDFVVPVPAGREYAAAFGLIENDQTRQGMRPLEVCVEGDCVRVIDVALESGYNRPLVLLYRTMEKGDGQLRLSVRAPGGAGAAPPMLSGLWVFPVREDSGVVPDPAEIASGGADDRALAWIDAERLDAMNRVDLVFPAGASAARLLFPRGAEAKLDELASLDTTKARERAVKWWDKADLPGEESIVLPDAAMQALYVASVRCLAQVGRDEHEALRAISPVAPGASAGVAGETLSLLGRGDDRGAAAALYALANHAAPTPGWGFATEPLGDIEWPTGFIRALRHALVYEEGDTLHLLAGLPRRWTEPGSRTEVESIPTRYGPVSLALSVDKKGREAALEVKAAWNVPPGRIVVHLSGLSGPVTEVRFGRELMRAPVQLADSRFTLRASLGPAEK